MKKIINISLLVLLGSISVFSSERSEAESKNNENKGYYLISPLANNNVFLIDELGEIAYQWETEYTPGNSVYLLEDGSLLRTESVKSRTFKAGGAAGRLAMYDPSSNEIWSYNYGDNKKLSHHDIEVLPNGNILIIAWEKFTKKEAEAKGLDTVKFTANEIWADHIIELNPGSNEIVWEWHVWDHLVQDYDPDKPGFGEISDNQRKINLNFSGTKEKKDWNHINSIDYNEELDQILLSVHSFSEIWIIDHSISTEEAKTDKGDLLYRWGNPEPVNIEGERELYMQHDAKWTTNNTIMVFNNGDRRNRPYSSVLEIRYDSGQGSGYLNPPEIIWEYESKDDFYAKNISGAQRLKNGNTLICDGPSGHLFEVTKEKEIVWEYTNPIFSKTPQKEINEIFRGEKYYYDFPGIVSLGLN
ncbi:MAG: hypothetical protein GY756_28080 [bacterium]|nr:hypothetical protein [bacterium]